MPEPAAGADTLKAHAPHAISFARRFRRYLAERFPLKSYLPLIAISAVAAAAWSRPARGAQGLPPALVLAAGAATGLVFFFVLRVADEHKDAEQDRRYRPELPVPRGLVALGELRMVAAGLGVAVLLANALAAPRLLYALVPAMAWAALMAREFFVAEWLRARPVAYLLSHMVVMPLLFAYLTGLDWLHAGADPPRLLPFYLGLAFFNGILIEIGRKIRAPEDERAGVDSYTSAWGTRAAATAWLAALAGAAAMFWFASDVPGIGSTVRIAAIPAIALLFAPRAVRFIRQPTASNASYVEAVSGVWTLVSYVFLGLVPLLG